DYSQIELRLLAGLSKDPALIDAFKNNKDIHDIAAERIFNVPKSKINKDLRSKAKMVNYGIAYGLSAFGLSRNLKIPMQEAREIIEQYFEEFESIKNFIDETIELAEEKGYSETMLGRKRYIKDINSRNKTVRKMAERIAINAPLQGLAADIIKIAMVNIDKILISEKLKSRMILQVHDELVFEVYKPELNKMLKIVKENMENPIDFGVPLEVNMGIGENWMELKKVSKKKKVY
ncbi:MAG: DNA polymerase I, partial [Bacteroidetes bacterium]|nr:DNA polymerase I [Bacteroidota bacterium]